MPRLLAEDHGAYLWWRATGAVHHAPVTTPRGLPTRERRNVILTLADPSTSMLSRELRTRYHPAIGIAEGLQIIAGISNPDLMERIAPKFAGLRENDGRLHGAYGLRLWSEYGGDQLMCAVKRLVADSDTRQAVCTIWDPRMDRHPRKDIPCTVDLVFSVRDGKLRLDTHMRSEDVWLGLPYDLLQFTMVQLCVAAVLGRPPGPYTHYVNSLHVYEADIQKLPMAMPSGVRYPRINALPGRDWGEMRQIAFDLLHGQPSIFEGFEPNAMTELCERLLAPYVKKAG